MTHHRLESAVFRHSLDRGVERDPKIHPALPRDIERFTNTRVYKPEVILG